MRSAPVKGFPTPVAPRDLRSAHLIMTDILKVDVEDFQRAATNMGATADQMPFILSLALNRAIKATRTYLVEHTWPEHIVQRNPTFIRRALRTQFSNKNDLTVEIYDDLGRASLMAHAEGGKKMPKGKSLAVPSRAVKRTSHGVARSQRPRNLPRSKTFVQNNRLYMTTGRGKGRRARLMYFLKPSVQIPKDVPFYQDFNAQVGANIMRELPGVVIQAMSTRKI